VAAGAAVALVVGADTVAVDLAAVVVSAAEVAAAVSIGEAAMAGADITVEVISVGERQACRGHRTIHPRSICQAAGASRSVICRRRVHRAVIDLAIRVRLVTSPILEIAEESFAQVAAAIPRAAISTGF
jgi:hypothetical protein